MNFHVTEQEPKPKPLGLCRVSLDQSGQALLMDSAGKTALYKLERAKVDWMAADGFMVSGFEETGSDRSGRKKFRLQSWFCRYLKD